MRERKPLDQWLTIPDIAHVIFELYRYYDKFEVKVRKIEKTDNNNSSVSNNSSQASDDDSSQASDNSNEINKNTKTNTDRMTAMREGSQTELFNAFAAMVEKHLEVETKGWEQLTDAFYAKHDDEGESNMSCGIGKQANIEVNDEKKREFEAAFKSMNWSLPIFGGSKKAKLDEVSVQAAV